MRRLLLSSSIILLIGCQDDKAQHYLETLDIAEQGIHSITIDTGSVTVREPNITAQWSASADLSSGSVLVYSDLVSWSSDAPTVATVSSSGEIRTLSAGVANISASYGRFSDVRPFTVSTAVLQSISLTPETISLDECKSVTVTAEGSYDDGTSREINDLLSWSTDDTSLATVQDQDGSGITIVSHLSGTGLLTASNNDGISGTASLTVLDTLSSIAIDKTSLAMTVGDSSSLNAQAEYSDSSSADITQSSNWSLDETEQSSYLSLSDSYSSKGELSAFAAGVAVVNVGCGGLVATQSTTVTVSAEATLQSLSFSPSDNPYVLSTGDTDKSLTLYANYSDGSAAVDVTADAIWEVASGDSDFIDIDTSDGNEGDILLDADIGDITEDKSISVQVSYGSLDAQIQITVEAP